MSFDLEQAALPPDASRTPIPQYYLSLSKRICAVARPIWLASLRPDEENTANYLNRALSIDGATDCIRSVDLAVATHEPAIYLALLAQLPRLESLALDFELLNTAEESLVVAKALTRFLRRSSHLKSLTLTRPTTHDDPDLILDRDVPTLRTLRTSGGAWTDGVLLRGACNLRFLDYRSANMAELVIPTYTLRRLRIAPSAYVESSPSFPRAFRRAFHVPVSRKRLLPPLVLSNADLPMAAQEADFPKTALRQLSLGFAVLNDHESDSFSSQHFLELLESLARSGIDTLEIGSAGIITLPERLLVEFAIPVKTLVIRGPLKLQVRSIYSGEACDLLKAPHTGQLGSPLKRRQLVRAPQRSLPQRKCRVRSVS